MPGVSFRSRDNRTAEAYEQTFSFEITRRPARLTQNGASRDTLRRSHHTWWATPESRAVSSASRAALRSRCLVVGLTGKHGAEQTRTSDVGPSYFGFLQFDVAQRQWGEVHLRSCKVFHKDSRLLTPMSMMSASNVGLTRLPLAANS